MVKKKITKFRLFFSSAKRKWFGTEFRAFFSLAKWFGIELISFNCFSLLQNGSDRNSERILTVHNGNAECPLWFSAHICVSQASQFIKYVKANIYAVLWNLVYNLFLVRFPVVDNTLLCKYMIKIKLYFLPNDTVSEIVLWVILPRK